MHVLCYMHKYKAYCNTIEWYQRRNVLLGDTEVLVSYATKVYMYIQMLMKVSKFR